MTYHLFDAFGIELEYMIVDADTLNVRPISDHVLRDAQGEIASDVDHGPISWSNELTHHVIEIKTNGPTADLSPLATEFQANVNRLNAQLASAHACLLPTAMHPWMNPDREMQLWPYDYNVVYAAFDRIFNCKGHGWANLQSMHINLPFANDAEFAQLHAAIRLVLPILPALAASSPLMEGQTTSTLDSRLEVYRKNSRKIPSIAGRVIPEPVYDQATYDREIFQRMFAEIAPHDPDGVLQEEFLNARGAIARFSRGAIEIRVIDLQECPAADLAIAQLTVATLKQLVAQGWTGTAEQQAFSVDQLEPILLATIQQADAAVIRDAAYLRQFGYFGSTATARELWQHLAAQCSLDLPALQTILNQGCLSRRILQALQTSAQPTTTPEAVPADRLREVYQELARCLSAGEMFLAH
ncbi:carboxylate-amine ligase [Planctomicrobium sp. SH664]|uniref:carboxylate-amine ligase n=1 Tax=Planctomicrobium sp. SH664 TaxID=3448125 RepID=UPI003F5B0BF0